MSNALFQFIFSIGWLSSYDYDDQDDIIFYDSRNENFFKQFESIFQWHCVMCCSRQTQRWIELKYQNKSVFHLIPKRWFQFEFELNAFMLLASSTHMHHYPFYIIHLIPFLLFLGPFLYFRVFLDLTSNLQKYIRQKITGYFYSRSLTLYTNFWTTI